MRLLTSLLTLTNMVQGARELSSYTFGQFVEEFNKDYDDNERALRQNIFEKNLEKIKGHNAQDFSWKMGVNQHADLSSEEFRALKGRGYNKHQGFAQPAQVNYDYSKTVPVSSLPSSVDWRDKKVVTAVKDQGGCGSCWTFGTTESVESHMAIKTGSLKVLSEQELVSCPKNPDHCGGTGGCQGATSTIAYEYLMKHGQSLESVYPYNSGFTGNNGVCKPDKPAAVNITSFVKVPSNNYTAVMNAIANEGPLSITVDASEWQLYSHGVFTPYDGYTSVDLDHVVQLVGYGVDANFGSYWLVRNSWAKVWGEEGYIRLKRNDGTIQYCGKDTKPADGDGCTGGPSSIVACGTCGILFDTSYPVV